MRPRPVGPLCAGLYGCFMGLDDGIAQVSQILQSLQGKIPSPGDVYSEAA